MREAAVTVPTETPLVTMPGPTTMYHSAMKPPSTTVATSRLILRRSVRSSLRSGNVSRLAARESVNAIRNTSPGPGQPYRRQHLEQRREDQQQDV